MTITISDNKVLFVFLLFPVLVQFITIYGMLICLTITRELPESVAVVPEVVLCVHGPVLQLGVLAPLDDLVPQDDLIHLD